MKVKDTNNFEQLWDSVKNAKMEIGVTGRKMVTRDPTTQKVIDSVSLNEIVKQMKTISEKPEMKNKTFDNTNFKNLVVYIKVSHDDGNKKLDKSFLKKMWVTVTRFNNIYNDLKKDIVAKNSEAGVKKLRNDLIELAKATEQEDREFDNSGDKNSSSKSNDETTKTGKKAQSNVEKERAGTIDDLKEPKRRQRTASGTHLGLKATFMGDQTNPSVFKEKPKPNVEKERAGTFDDLKEPKRRQRTASGTDLGLRSTFMGDQTKAPLLKSSPEYILPEIGRQEGVIYNFITKLKSQSKLTNEMKLELEVLKGELTYQESVKPQNVALIKTLEDLVKCYEKFRSISWIQPKAIYGAIEKTQNAFSENPNASISYNSKAVTQLKDSINEWLESLKELQTTNDLSKLTEGLKNPINVFEPFRDDIKLLGDSL